MNIVHTSSFGYIWRLEEFHNAIQIHYGSIFKMIQRSVHIFRCNRLERCDKIREHKKMLFKPSPPEFCLLISSTFRYDLIIIKKLFLSILLTLDSLNIFTSNKAQKNPRLIAISF